MFALFRRRSRAFVCIPFAVAAATLVGCSVPVLETGSGHGAVGQGLCPVDWEHYGGHCYGLTTDVNSWDEAEAEALAAGGHLVTVNDEDEQLWLNEMFPFEQGSMWIGLHQNPGSAEPHLGWEWISGESVTYTNWAADQPDEGPPDETNEDRAVTHAVAPGLWMDVRAEAYYVGIMEVDPAGLSVPSPPEQPPLPPWQPVPMGWTESWETADLGPKHEGEVFTADAGSWEAFIDRSIQPPWLCSETDVEIVPGVEGQSLLLHARADTEPQPRCPISIAAVFSTTLHRIPLSEDTRILGSWHCAVDFEHARRRPGEHASGFILIAGLGCHVRYLHDASVTSTDDDFASTYIVVGDNFDRNLYDDMVGICGQDFVERYDGATIMRTVNPAVFQTSASAYPIPYGAGVLESMCDIRFLTIAD